VSTRGKCRCLPRYCRCTCSISRNQEDAPRRLPPPPTAFRVRVSELNRSFIARGFSSVPLQIKPYHRGAAELVRCCQDSEANTFQTLFIMSATAGRTPLLSHANPTSIHALITSPNGCFVWARYEHDTSTAVIGQRRASWGKCMTVIAIWESPLLCTSFIRQLVWCSLSIVYYSTVLPRPTLQYKYSMNIFCYQHWEFLFLLLSPVLSKTPSANTNWIQLPKCVYSHWRFCSSEARGKLLI